MRYRIGHRIDVWMQRHPRYRRWQPLLVGVAVGVTILVSLTTEAWWAGIVGTLYAVTSLVAMLWAIWAINEDIKRIEAETAVIQARLDSIWASNHERRRTG